MHVGECGSGSDRWKPGLAVGPVCDTDNKAEVVICDVTVGTAIVSGTGPLCSGISCDSANLALETEVDALFVTVDT